MVSSGVVKSLAILDAEGVAVERFVALDTSSEERSALLVFLSGYFGGCLGIALGRRGGGRLERGMLVRRESGRVRGWECDVMVRPAGRAGARRRRRRRKRCDRAERGRRRSRGLCGVRGRGRGSSVREERTEGSQAVRQSGGRVNSE